MSTYVCPQCGLDYDTISPSDAKVAIRSFPRRYRAALAAGIDDDSDEAVIRRRPEPDVWSALEYTAHVADLLGASVQWVHALRTRDRPTLDGPATTEFDAVKGTAGSADRALDALGRNADALASELDRVQSAEWHRVGSFPWGERDVLMTARNAVHEGSHHLRDVQQVLDRVRGR